MYGFWISCLGLVFDAAFRRRFQPEIGPGYCLRHDEDAALNHRTPRMLSEALLGVSEESGACKVGARKLYRMLHHSEPRRTLENRM